MTRAKDDLNLVVPQRFFTHGQQSQGDRHVYAFWTSELKDRKIRTNVLSPGPVDTPMFDAQFPSKEGAAEARKQITAMTPLARLARPEEIASAALFLASDQSSYVAGIDLPVDSGLTAV
jgi:NAD(P)-dependent dehydrogenase (short-subunit alcohol dehydrogenase family)